MVEGSGTLPGECGTHTHVGWRYDSLTVIVSSTLSQSAWRSRKFLLDRCEPDPGEKNASGVRYSERNVNAPRGESGFVRFSPCECGLPYAQQLPPGETDDRPNENVDHRRRGSYQPPSLERHIALREEHRRGG